MKNRFDFDTEPDWILDVRGLKSIEAAVLLEHLIRVVSGEGGGELLVITGRGNRGASNRSSGQRQALRKMVTAKSRANKQVLWFRHPGPYLGGSGSFLLRISKKRVVKRKRKTT